jgi:hypothetical protein
VAILRPAIGSQGSQIRPPVHHSIRTFGFLSMATDDVAFGEEIALMNWRSPRLWNHLSIHRSARNSMSRPESTATTSNYCCA